MCGIIGFTGNSQAATVLLDGLSKLEYRGYDLAGIAVDDGENETEVIKESGTWTIRNGGRKSSPASIRITTRDVWE